MVLVSRVFMLISHATCLQSLAIPVTRPSSTHHEFTFSKSACTTQLDEERQRLQRKEEHCVELERQMRSLSDRLSAVHTDFARSMREKDREREQEIQNLENLFSSRLQSMQLDPATGAMRDRGKGRSAGSEAEGEESKSPGRGDQGEQPHGTAGVTAAATEVFRRLEAMEK